MEFKKILPSLVLRPYVRNYWLFDVNERDIPFAQLLFPFGSFELIINLQNAPQMKMVGDKSTFTQPDSLYLGQFTRPFVLNFTKSTKCIGVSLQPWIGKLLFKFPAQEFTDRVMNVGIVDDKWRLREKLLEAKTESEWLAHLEIFLEMKLKNFEADTVSSKIANSIINSPTTQEFKNIVSSIGFTRRRIEQRFLETTGLPMGFFVRKVRFQKAVNLLRVECQHPLTAIGYQAGYYDQAHFIREFKEFSGLSPSKFLKETSQMKEFVRDLMLVE